MAKSGDDPKSPGRGAKQKRDTTREMLGGNDSGEQKAASVPPGSRDATRRAPSPPLPPGTKIKILFLAANPPGTNQNAIQEEIRQITAKIRAAEYRDSLEPISVWAVNTDDLQQALLTHKPHIVHFSGHGKGSQGLLLNDQKGNPKRVSAQAISALFEALRDNIRVVLLNGCWADDQAEAIAQSIGVAVGMNDSLAPEPAIAFAASLYRGIGFGRTVKEAFDLGGSSILLEGFDKATPPHIRHHPDVNPSELRLIRRIEKHQEIHTLDINPDVNASRTLKLPVNPDPQAREKYRAKLAPKLVDLLERLPAKEKESNLASIGSALKIDPIAGTKFSSEAIVRFMLDKEITVPRLERFIADSTTSSGNETTRILEQCLDRIVPWHFPDHVVQSAAGLTGPDRQGFLQSVVVTRLGAELVMAAIDQECIEIDHDDDERPGKHGHFSKDLPAFGEISTAADAELFLRRVFSAETRKGRDSELEWYREQTGRSKYCVVQLSLLCLSVDGDYAIRLLEAVSELQPGLPIFCLTEKGLAKDRELLMLDTVRRRRKANRM